MNLWIKYFIAWFPMLVLAILNGTLRDLGYKKYMRDLAAHQLSTLTLIIFLGFYMMWIVRKYPPLSSGQSVALGLFWTILILIFEFGFGRYRGNSWAKLFADYNILTGHVWILIPLWVAVAPYIFYRLFKS